MTAGPPPAPRSAGGLGKAGGGGQGATSTSQPRPRLRPGTASTKRCKILTQRAGTRPESLQDTFGPSQRCVCESHGPVHTRTPPRYLEQRDDQSDTKVTPHQPSGFLDLLRPLLRPAHEPSQIM